MKRKFLGAFICLVTLVSCVTSVSTITWQPAGGPSATLSLESDDDTSLFAAIRTVNGEYQANPWYLFVPGASAFESPRVLGRGRPADTVILDAGAYDFELEIYESGGLLGKTGWRDERLPIHIKALKPDTRYSLVMSENLPLKGRAENSLASLSLYEQGVMEKLVQRWFITGLPEKGKENKLIFIVKSYGIVEDEELSFF